MPKTEKINKQIKQVLVVKHKTKFIQQFTAISTRVKTNKQNKKQKIIVYANDI